MNSNAYSHYYIATTAEMQALEEFTINKSCIDGYFMLL